MKKISLTQGKFALVDDQDYDFFNRVKWYAVKSTNTWYAKRAITLPFRKYKWIYMYNCIFPLTHPFEVDHIDGNGLNNQRDNLRICTPSENRINQPKRVKGTSIFKGVSWCERDQKWTVRLRIDGRSKNLGNFDDEQLAAKTYDQFAKKTFGEFARLNFSEVNS